MRHLHARSEDFLGNLPLALEIADVEILSNGRRYIRNHFEALREMRDVTAERAFVGDGSDEATMFNETEIRREDEYRVSAQVAEKELEMALLLVNNLVVAFHPSKYRDGYRDKLDELVEAKLHARTMSAAEQRRPAPVVNILDALRRSLESDRGTPASQTPVPPNNKRRRSRTKQRSANDTQPAAGLQA